MKWVRSSCHEPLRGVAQRCDGVGDGGDKRLNKRLVKVVQQWADKPTVANSSAAQLITRFPRQIMDLRSLAEVVCNEMPSMGLNLLPKRTAAPFRSAALDRPN